MDMHMNMMGCSSQKMSGAGKGRPRKKKHPPRRGMGVAQLERTLRTQHHSHWNLPPPPTTAAAELPPSFPNAMCCPHLINSNHNYYLEDVYPFHLSPFKKKRANGEEMEAIWGSATHNMGYLPNHLQGEGEGEAPAQVLAVHHRAGKGAHRKLVMEYGFFPASGAAASSSPPGYGDATPSIDLSLRL